MNRSRQKISLGTAGLLTVAALTWSAVAPAGSVDYPNFNDISELELNGSAQAGKGIIRLTSGTGQAGSVFTTQKVVATKRSLKSRFTIDMNGSFDPGDGMAFVIQSGEDSALGSDGSGLGYQGIKPSLAVEFDIYAGDGDPDGNHVGIVRNGKVEKHVKTASPDYLLYDKKLYAWVSYSAKTKQLKVFLNKKDRKPKAPLLKSKNNLAKILEARKARAGFTAGTGDAFINADLHSWNLTQP